MRRFGLLSRIGTAWVIALGAGSALTAVTILQQFSAGPALADTAPFELFCTNTPIGSIVFNNVVLSGGLSPMSPMPGESFSLVGFQEQIPIPAGILQDASTLGNTLTGTATATLAAVGATPSSLTTGALGFSAPIPEPIPSSGATLNTPNTPTTIGPFSATSSNISLSLGSSITISLKALGSSPPIECSAYANDVLASGIAQGIPPGVPISPVIAVAGIPPSPPPANALTGPYEIYCPHTPVGDLVFNGVTTTASLTPSTLSAGDQFEVTGYQTSIPVPPGVAEAAAGLGNDAFDGVAASAVDAYGATPARISTGSMSFDVPIPSPPQSSSLSLDIPTSPATVGPFSATGGPVVVTQDQATLVVAQLSGKAFKMSCTAYPNDTIANSGTATAAPDATPIRPIIAVSTASGTPVTTSPPTTTNQTPGEPYELYCPSTPVGNIVINDVVTTGSISPQNLEEGEDFSLTGLQTQFTIPQSVAQQAENLGLTTFSGNLFAFTNVSGVEESGSSYPIPLPTILPGPFPFDFSFDVSLPSPVPSSGVQFTAAAPPGVATDEFTAAGGPIQISISGFSLDVSAFGDEFGTFCDIYANDSEPTGLATESPTSAPVEPVIATGEATVTTSPPPSPTGPPTPSPVVPPASAASSSGCEAAGYSGNSAFVCLVYKDLLGRMPDPSGLATFSGLLNSGTSLAQVAYDVLGSTEYRADMLRGIYQSFLGRDPDQGGLATYLGLLSSGASEQQVIADIVGSAEFFSDAGSTNAGFVNRTYLTVLGRPADPGGVSTYLGLLDSGTSRAQVATDFLDSTESRTDAITFYYRYLLGRAPDPGGLATYLAVFKSGGGVEQLIADLVGSAEFYNDATG